MTRVPETSENSVADRIAAYDCEDYNLEQQTTMHLSVRMQVWERVGGYIEDMEAPEDLLFLHKHVELGGLLLKLDQPLLTYRYHAEQRSWRVPRRVLLQAKVGSLLVML